MWPHRFQIPLVSIGLLLACIGAISGAVGMNFVREGRNERHLPLHERKHLLVGITLVFVVNTTLDLIGFALSPLALIAPIGGGVTIAASVLFARLGCVGAREYVSGTQVVALVLVILGVVVVSAYGPQVEPVLNATVVLGHVHKVEWLQFQTLSMAVVASTAVTVCFGRLTSMQKVVSSAIAAGFCSSICQNLLKMLSTVAVSCVLTERIDALSSVDLWVAVVELAVVGVVLMWLLSICLGEVQLSFSSPLYQSACIVLTIAASSVIFSDLSVVTWRGLGLFISGVLCILLGLSVLVRTQGAHERVPQQDAADVPDDVCKRTLHAVHTPAVLPPATVVDAEIVLDPEL